MSAIFTLAKQQDYFQAENPARDTAINPGAAEPQETYAYSLEEIQGILSRLPEPAATAFAIAAFMGLRYGEIRGLLWENYRNEEMHVTRSIWNGRITDPKTRKGRAPVPVIRQLAERLEMHRLRCGNPQTGPIFANCARKAARHCQPHESVYSSGAESLRTLRESGVSPPEGGSRIQARQQHSRVARLARGTARPWEQSVPPGCAGYGDSANPSSREREHDGNLLHQDSRRRCPQRNDETGKSHCRGSEEPSGH